ncbi:uncharacterized protein MELLADRAFT_93599 [Melampsora larici-populina 98AG31]|uniref:Protein kinase domain-containing protein n=1 Tax=Melampsora larici-populina (strain 98AG31 / pathotype 3-4-7) TaxID=747676 RepID=F4RB09_MELLP|nr:uncharacterized protein MELLADRAFT_93599 [Melampsora larici-populina 98AG31]EGG10682.1 hypothetical protein MELLADRAFT_93599 [Melampsora larici-populina 98AG31]
MLRSVVHEPLKQKVVIKKITFFNHSIVFCLRILREIKLFRWFSHKNIISILDIVKPSSIEEFSEVHLIQASMETDMHQMICFFTKRSQGTPFSCVGVLPLTSLKTI